MKINSWPQFVVLALIFAGVWAAYDAAKGDEVDPVMALVRGVLFLLALVVGVALGRRLRDKPRA